MNIQLNRLVILSLVALSFFACEKDEDRVVVRQGTPAALTASASTLVLDRTNAGADALTFTATPSNYGFNAAVTYTLELAKKGSNFSDSVAVAMGSTREKKFTVTEFNNLLSQLELQPDAAGQVEARVKSQVAPSIAPVYSNVVTITATPYVDIRDYPSIYVPGGYQGWSPDKAAKLASVGNNQVYEGYINFPEANSEFKFTLGPNWDNNLGVAATAKSLTANGGNLKVTEPGYYLVKANLKEMTWDAIKTNWGVIGSATASGWGSDQNMTYDPATGTWKVTLDLTADEIKFRANDDWAINYGENKPANGFLRAGDGDNIKIPAAGRYDITLDLSIAGNYRYTLKKL